MRYLIVIMMFVALIPVKSFAGVCPIEDLECLAPILLPKYSTDPDHADFKKEWTSYNGETFAYEDRIVVKTRFDQEALDILNSGDFGLEVDVVLKGSHRNIGLKEVRSTFPSNAKVGKDTPVFDWLTNESDSRTVGLHVLNPSALSAEVDYYSIFIFDDDLPSEGIEVSNVTLQITVDIDYGPFLQNLIVDQIPQLDQFQYYVLETDSHQVDSDGDGDYDDAFTAYPDGSSAICWYDKTDSEPCQTGQCIVGQSFDFLQLIGISSAHAASCSTPNGTSVPVRNEVSGPRGQGSGSGNSSSGGTISEDPADADISIRKFWIREKGGSYTRAIDKTIFS